MRLRKAKRLGSYVKFQLLPKWTESGELVCCEYVRATYNGNDLGVVTVERLKPAKAGEVCGRMRDNGPTPCHYPNCDCSGRVTWDEPDKIVELVDIIEQQRREEINKHAAAYRKEYAEQDAWDAMQLARQHGNEMPSRSGEVHLFKLKTPPGKDVTANQDIPPFVYGKIIHEPEPPECTMYHPGCGCNHCVSQEWAMENGRYRPGDEVTGYGT